MKLRCGCTKGKTPSIGRSGADFMAPTSISGATSPAPRAMARIMPVMMPGMCARQNDPLDGLPFAGAAGVRPSRIELGTAARASSVVTITTGSVNKASVSEAQNRPPVPNVGGFRPVRRKKQLIDLHADARSRKIPGRTRRTQCSARPARLLIAIRSDADHGPTLGVLAQVQRRQHAERNDGQGHDQRHGHGAPDRGKHAPFAVGFARIVGEKLAPPRQVDRQPSEPSQAIGRDRRGQFALRARFFLRRRP